MIADDILDAEATERRRETIRSKRFTLSVVESEDDAYETVGRGTKRVVRLHPGDAEAIGVREDEMAELLADGGAPLRGWARLDAGVERGSVALDKFGRSVLRVAAGDRVRPRRLHLPAPK
jgi:anaerobic selenocysteine-containing dehydrogenase